jgi:hypothetical protein
MGYINGPQMFRHVINRLAVRMVGAICAAVMLASVADAAELVMYRRAGCSWCATWDREIGPIYPKTELGRRAPMRMVDLDRGDRPAINTRAPIRYSPTFVLVENGQELGRIEGYPGDAFFWGLLEAMLERLPARNPKAVSAPGASRAAAAERRL